MNKKALIIIVAVCFFFQMKELSASFGRFFKGVSGAFNQARVVAQSFRAPALQGVQTARQLVREGTQRIQALPRHPSILQFQAQMRDPEIRDAALDTVVPVVLGTGLFGYLLSLRVDRADQLLKQMVREIKEEAEQEERQIQQNELLRIQNERQVQILLQKQREQLLAEEIRSLQKKLFYTTALTALEEEHIKADLNRLMSSPDLSAEVSAELTQDLEWKQGTRDRMRRADEEAAAEWARRKAHNEPLWVSTFESAYGSRK